jgi:hypothetical protein
MVKYTFRHHVCGQQISEQWQIILWPVYYLCWYPKTEEKKSGPEQV